MTLKIIEPFHCQMYSDKRKTWSTSMTTALREMKHFTSSFFGPVWIDLQF